ncbi:MAG TPA: ankyrin repeat domain-containing protein [Pseudobdellovibrionaceae bacterium]|nr:ankyrin repeat domain-containing protein [Pseudobdellovibrionaceae bacterium]
MRLTRSAEKMRAMMFGSVGRCIATSVILLITISVGCATNEVSMRPEPKVSAWYRAARLGDLQVLEAELRAGKDVNSVDENGVSALMVASHNGQVRAVSWLLDRGANSALSDIDRQSALLYALVGAGTPEQKSEMAILLLASGADPFQVDRTGAQPVRELIALGFVDVVKSLFRPQRSGKLSCRDADPKPGELGLVGLAESEGHAELSAFLKAQGCR